METILLIEDDPVMLRGLRDNFTFAGYHVLSATDGERGLELATNSQPDLILLDVMLPKINGYEICRLLREQKVDTPIVILSARGQESEVVLGLHLGADEYVSKPFSIKELLARVEAILRRRRDPAESRIVFGSCVLDIVSRRLIREGVEIKLSPKEWELLHFLARKPNHAYSRDEIFNKVWGYENRVTSRSIDRFITTLRQKIEHDPHHPTHLLTVREYGYKLVR
jgi:DNA-binding response OmpR family regulator